jgi:hypothetical protein
MLLYKTTRVFVHKPTNEIVAGRRLILKDGSTFNKEEYDPIRIKDIAILTNRYETEKSNILKCNYTHLVTGEYRSKMSEPVTSFAGAVTAPTLFGFTSFFDNPELSETDFNILLEQFDRGDQLVEFCLTTQTSMVDIFTPFIRKQSVNGPQKKTSYLQNKTKNKY